MKSSLESSLSSTSPATCKYLWFPPLSNTRRVAGGDDFIDNLWKVHLRVKEEGYVQVSLLKVTQLGTLLTTNSEEPHLRSLPVRLHGTPRWRQAAD
jgi:hypothetical protein